ncbi:MAG TPA: hypothetical protein VF529_22315 [Solirubrobacteraceae bacterium]|jgi:hypothetical protein
MPDFTRIDEDRGRFVGLAGVLLAVFVFVLIARNSDWSAFVKFLIFGVTGAAVIAPAYLIPQREGPPPGWLSALLVAGFALTAGFWVSLADLLGANTDDLASSTVTWISILLAAEFAFLSLRRDSAVCTLLAAGAAVVALLAFIDWVFSPDGPSTFRYVAIVEGLVLVAAGVALYRERGRHAVVLTVLSGIVILGMALSFGGALFIETPFGGGGPEGVGWGWELVVLLFAVGLTAFAAMSREPGPGYAAAALFVAFVAITTVGEDGFIGWPLLLLLATGGAIAAFLMGPDRPGPAATTATTTTPATPTAETTRETRL